MMCLSLAISKSLAKLCLPTKHDISYTLNVYYYLLQVETAHNSLTKPTHLLWRTNLLTFKLGR